LLLLLLLLLLCWVERRLLWLLNVAYMPWIKFAWLLLLLVVLLRMQLLELLLQLA
jgi:hypothetical protein